MEAPLAAKGEGCIRLGHAPLEDPDVANRGRCVNSKCAAAWGTVLQNARVRTLRNHGPSFQLKQAQILIVSESVSE